MTGSHFSQVHTFSQLERREKKTQIKELYRPYMYWLTLPGDAVGRKRSS
jgi:hypothetical protein